MATQAIRFTAPPGQTITLDVVAPSTDTLEQSGLVCTEATNDKGTYVTANFTDTLAGRHSIIKKIDGEPIGKSYVTLANANGTYEAEDLANPKDTIRGAVGGQWEDEDGNTFTLEITDPV